MDFLLTGVAVVAPLLLVWVLLVWGEKRQRSRRDKRGRTDAAGSRDDDDDRPAAPVKRFKVE